MGQVDYAGWAQVGNNIWLKYKVQWWHTDYLVLVNKGQFALGPQVEKKNVCKSYTHLRVKSWLQLQRFLFNIYICAFLFLAHLPAAVGSVTSYHAHQFMSSYPPIIYSNKLKLWLCDTIGYLLCVFEIKTTYSSLGYRMVEKGATTAANIDWWNQKVGFCHFGATYVTVCNAVFLWCLTVHLVLLNVYLCLSHDLTWQVSVLTGSGFSHNQTVQLKNVFPMWHLNKCYIPIWKIANYMKCQNYL